MIRRRINNLGDTPPAAPIYEDYFHPWTLPDCGFSVSACASRNAGVAQMQQAWDDARARYTADTQAYNTRTYGTVYTVPAPAAPPPPYIPSVSYTPRLTFSNATTGNNQVFTPGDSWSVTITGMKPGQSIRLTGGANGTSSTSTMGAADSTGRFATSGTITANQVGTWFESWDVGEPAPLTFSFTVAPTPAPPAVTLPGIPTPPAHSSTEPTTAQGTKTTNPAATAATPSGFNINALFSAVPWYVWASGAAVLLLGKK